MPTVTKGPDAPEYKALSVRSDRGVWKVVVETAEDDVWLASVLMEAVPTLRDAGRSNVAVCDVLVEDDDDDDDVVVANKKFPLPTLLLDPGPSVKCLFLPKELVCAHTFNESKGCPSTTPTNPAA